jgi:diguanylate cyclase (GGDEF)-like protein
VVAAAALYVSGPDGWLRNILYDGHAVASLAAMIWVASRCKAGTQRRAWGLFTLGFSFWVIGDVYYNIAQPGDAPFSVVDVLYFAGYAFLAAGLLLLGGLRAKDKLASLMDGLIVSSSLFLLAWGLLIDPIADKATASATERIAASAYPALDLLLLTLAVRLVVGRRTNGASRLVVLGVLLCLIGDAAWRGYVLDGSWNLGSPINAFYIAGYGCFAVAMLHPSARRSALAVERTPKNWRSVGLFGLAVPAVPLAPLLVANGFDATDGVAISVGGGVWGIALVLRLARMVIARDQLASRDPLTALPNRRLFQSALDQAAHGASAERPGALILMDLDNLKLVNDVAGHQAGDQLLRSVATIVRETVRPKDIVARVGGDEFAVIAPHVAPEDAKLLGERLVSQIARMGYITHGVPIDHTVSAGLALLAGAGSEAIYAAADAALYEAKLRGRNRLATAADGTPSTSELLHASTKAAELRKALSEDRLVCFLQPIASLRSGTIQGYEALARIIDTDGAVIGPESFISAAEAFGLVPAIDHRMLEAVLDMLDREPDLRISSNLATESFFDDSIVDVLERRLPSIGPGRLMLEITEATAMASLQRSPERLERLRTLGCWMALDDFGEGFSSFAQLVALQVDVVKIPRSLTTRVIGDEAGRAVLQGIVATVHALGKRITCEGIENIQLVKELQDLAVDYGQGYYWGRPMPASTYSAPETQYAATA